MLTNSYVRTFKPSTIKKVLKDPSKAPDVLPQLLAVTATRLAAPLSSQASSPSPSPPSSSSASLAASPASSPADGGEQQQSQQQSQRDLAAAARTLKGLSQCSGFGMALLLLSDEVRGRAHCVSRRVGAVAESNVYMCRLFEWNSRTISHMSPCPVTSLLPLFTHCPHILPSFLPPLFQSCVFT